MPLSPADRIAILVLAAIGLVGTALGMMALLRGRHGPFLTFLAAVNRLYLKFWFRWESNGPAPLPDTGSAIIVANHTSPLDPPSLQCGTDRLIRYLIAREYYEAPVLHWIYQHLRLIPINRTGQDAAAAKAALRGLKQGDVLGIFPEGGINLTGRPLLDPRPGVAMMALRSRAPVIPAYIEGAPRGSTMIRSFLTPGRIRVTFGPPMDFSCYYGREKDRDVLETVSGLIMSELARLGGVEDRWSGPRESTSERSLTQASPER